VPNGGAHLLGARGSPHHASVQSSEGVITKASPRDVDETVKRLVQLLDDKELTVFSIVDHSGAAQRAGLEMPNTKLVIFGSPVAGTPVMVAAPLAALDLPLKLLVWEDAEGKTWVSYTAPSYLAARHHLADALRARLEGIEAISDAVVSP
jgi:uncharacterized protein (DUF302 family)